MITRNFEDYPEHRPKFFELLRAITNHCFRAMLSLSPDNLKLVIDSVVWAFRHTERNVAEMGLNLLLEMLHAFQQSEFCNQFYQLYYVTLMQEVRPTNQGSGFRVPYNLIVREHPQTQNIPGK